ncbi:MULTISPECIES: hypothetical protein [unclassified Nonomuraea]|uniref:MarR family transcriptional regulator n=1 Tax=unclassified Nonomuraea TaxID=2593643 RepID=UPI0033CD05F6
MWIAFKRIPGELRDAMDEEMRLMQAAVDSFDEAAADVLGVNRTDLRCLDILAQGPVTPSVLEPALGLTTGSVTAMLDRLEKLVVGQASGRAPVAAPTRSGRGHRRRRAARRRPLVTKVSGQREPQDT